MTYRYQAYTTEKTLVTGMIEAASESQAEEALYQSGINYIVNLKRTRPKPTIYSLIPSLFGVKQADIIEFSRQLASFIESGVTLHAALQLVSDQISKPALKVVVEGIEKELQGGSSFSQAISHYPDQFSYSYYQIIKASEHAGDLEGGLRQIADYMEKQAKIRSSIRRALTYPALVTVMAIGVFILMVTVVLPPILELFSSLNATLPFTTKAVIATVDFFSAYNMIILMAVVVIGAGLFVYSRLPAGKLAIDKIALKSPFIGRIIVQRTMGQFCRTTYMMLKSGMQLPEILQITVQTVSSNRVVVKALEEVRQKLVAGQGFSRPMSENALFPPTMVKMIAMAEQTGSIDEAILTLANFYEERANSSVQSLIAMIEPTVTIVMGIGVAFILVSILMPMYSILSSLR